MQGEEDGTVEAGRRRLNLKNEGRLEELEKVVLNREGGVEKVGTI